MRTTRTYAVTVLMLVALAGMPRTAGAATDDDIRKVEAEWARALVAADVAALDGIFADDLVYVHSTGGIDTKQKFLDSIKSGSLRFKAVTPRDVRVRSYGNVGVVNALYDLILSSRGGNATMMTIQYVNVWVKERGKWSLVTQQTTRLPGPTKTP